MPLDIDLVDKGVLGISYVPGIGCTIESHTDRNPCPRKLTSRKVQKDHKMKISKIPGLSGQDKGPSSARPAGRHPQLRFQVES